MTSELKEIFRWRKSSEEVPFYKEFGHSPEVVGITQYRDREIYRYIKGEWFNSVTFSEEPCIPPIYWHYLPQRPSQEEIDIELNN